MTSKSDVELLLDIVRASEDLAKANRRGESIRRYEAARDNAIATATKALRERGILEEP